MYNTIEPGTKSVEGGGVYAAYEVSGAGGRTMRKLLHGRLSSIVNHSVKSFFYSSARTFGWYFLALGIVTLLMNLLEYYFLDDPNVPISALILGAVFSIVAIPLVIIDKPLALAFQSFPLTNFIFFEFFAIHRGRENLDYKPIHPIFGLFFGIATAVCGYFTSIATVMTVLISLLFAIIALISPEFPFIFNLAVFPFLGAFEYSKELLVCLTLLSVISFFRKVMVGKRVLFLEIYDLIIILFAIMATVSAIVKGGGDQLTTALYILAMSTSYIPASNIVVNRRLADCAMNAIVVSSVPVSIFCIVNYLTGLVGEGYAAQSFFMPSPEILAAFLLSVSVMTLFLAHEKKRVFKKLFYALTFIGNILGIISTERYFVIIPLIVVILSLNVIKAKNLPKEIILCIILLPILIFIIPDGALNWLSGVLGVEVGFVEMRSGFLAAIRAFYDNMFFGVPSPESHTAVNFLISVSLKYGVFALVCIVLLISIRLSHLSVYAPYVRISTVRPYVRMSFLAFVSLMSFGIFVDIVSCVEMYFMIFSIYGLCSATLRISKKETDDRLSYYGDSRSSESSVIEVAIRK